MRSKRIASSVYPDDEVEKVYTSDEPLPSMPNEMSFRERAARHSKAQNFFGMSRDWRDHEMFSTPPPLTETDRTDGVWPVNASNGTWPVNRRSSFYSFATFLSPLFLMHCGPTLSNFLYAFVSRFTALE